MSCLIHQPTQQVIASTVLKAHTCITRLKGLLGKKDLPLSHTLWILPCKGIHTFFMQFPLDLVFVTRNLTITYVVTQVAPWKMINSPLFSRTYSVFEFKTPSLKKLCLQKGDRLYVGA